MLNFDIELSLKKPVIGIDDVGRGPLAGPVISCACIFLDYSIEQSELLPFDDSKKLSLKKRKMVFEIILHLKKIKKLKYALGFANVKEIDSFNILEATKISMIRAVKKLEYKNDIDREITALDKLIVFMSQISSHQVHNCLFWR